MSSLMAPPVSFSYAPELPPDPEELFPPEPELELPPLSPEELLFPPLPELELFPSEPVELLFPPEPEELLFPPLLVPPALTMAWLIICWSCSMVIPAIAALEEVVVGPAEETILFLILNPSICKM